MIARRAPVWMFLALVVGLAGGIAMSGGAPGLTALLAVARPVGQLWLDALTMTVVPLVFGLVVSGIASAARAAEANAIVWRSLIAFAILLTIACVASAGTATAFLHFWPVGAAPPAVAGPVPDALPAAEWFHGIVPTNPIKAAAETAMVPIVVFALIFGFAVSRIEPALDTAMLTLCNAVVQAMLVIVGWVLRIAPLGILALAFKAGAQLGVGAAGALAQYVVLVVTACLVATIIAYIAAALAGGMSIVRFARAAVPAQAVALGTQSSLASLPIMVEAAPALGVTADSAGIVLPLAVSLFRAASAAANVAVAVYLGHLHGTPLPITVLAAGALVAVPVSLAAVGLPAQVSFFATIGPVCLAMGVPIEALPLLLAVETVPDLFRTLGNVTTDLAVTRIVGRCA